MPINCGYDRHNEMGAGEEGDYRICRELVCLGGTNLPANPASARLHGPVSRFFLEKGGTPEKQGPLADFSEYQNYRAGGGPGA